MRAEHPSAWLKLAVAIAAAVVLALPARAMEPPTKEQIEQYRKDGTLAQRIANAKAIGNDRMDPRLRARVQVKLERARLQAEGKTAAEAASLAPLPPMPGMPTTGTLRMFALLIAFPDYPPANTSAYISARLGGAGNPADYPYESLHNFYQRSSYGQLNIQCDTLGWYVPTYPRSSMPTTAAARDAVIWEAIKYYDNSGWDFSQYDNDGDGFIDYFAVFWTGPADGWGMFWWPYKTFSTGGTSYVVDGKELRDYSWQWESPSGQPFDPKTPIHETGHALGLPDYYDYNGSAGPNGGLGGFDMMDNSAYDHNCFSKWCLGWITPTIVSSGISTITLRPADSYGDAVLVMQNTPADDPFTEYFLAQYRAGGGNDSAGPGVPQAGGNGIAIWHVDYRSYTDGSQKYDNSSTAHKLLRLMEADGLEEIEATGTWNPADLYVPGKTLGLSTAPNSRRYDGADSRITVDNFLIVGSSRSARFSVNTPASLAIPNDQLPYGEVNHAYPGRVTITGGTAPYHWSLVSGSLPAGLSLVASTGAITGTPNASGTSNFTLRVTDSQGSPASATMVFSIAVSGDLVVFAYLAPGQVGVDYFGSVGFAGIDGGQGMEWITLAGGSLPPGLTLVPQGYITGTPTAAGTWNFTAKVTSYSYNNDTVYDTATQALSITIDPGPLCISTVTLVNASAGTAYNQTVTALGGTPPYLWSIASGTLPPGLSLVASTGAITGTPAATGTSGFTVMAADSQGVPATATKALSIQVVDALVIATTSLPDGHIDATLYSQTLAATGGVGPYIWSCVSGSLPDGLSFNPGTGVLSGTPTTAGAWSFTVRVTDRQAPPGLAARALSITVTPGPPVVATSVLATGRLGAAYNETLMALGGTAPYTWALVSGSLPPGLSLTASTGAITGTPTALGTANFTVMVADSDSPAATATKALSIAVPPPVMVTTLSLPAGQLGVAYSRTLTATGGQIPYTWRLSTGSLPAGLTLDGATGVISGTPTALGTFIFDVYASDSQSPPDEGGRHLAIAVITGTPDTYYVATTGSNSNPGTSAQPWRTLQHAVDTIAAGDTIVVRAGTYQGCWITLTGASNAVKTLKSDIGATVTVQGAYPGLANEVMRISSGGMPVSYWVIDGLAFSGSSHTNLCIELNNTANVTIRNCAFSQSCTYGVYAYSCPSLLVDNSSFSSNSSCGVCLVGSASDNVTIRNNTFTNGDQGIYAYGNDGEGDGLINNLLITGNKCVNTYGGLYLDGVTDSTIANNLAYGTQGDGIWLHGYYGAACASNNLIYNNTIVRAGTGNWCVRVSSASGKPAPTGNKIKNNILYCDIAGLGSETLYAPGIPGFESDYNVVVDRFSADNGATLVSLATWRGYGYDAHSVLTSDPSSLFANYAGADYHLKSGSPAIDAGMTVAQVTTDKDGAARPQGAAYDIGCYEMDPSGPKYWFAASDSESSTTNTGYVTKVAVSFTTPSADDWIIFGFCEFKCPNTNYATFVQLFVDAAGEAQNTRKPVDPTDYLPFISVKVKNLAPGPHSIQLKYRAGDAAAAAYVRNARICAVRKAALEFYSVAFDNAKPLTINSTDIAVLTWTPAATGNYLVISTGEINASTTVSTDLQTIYNGVVNDEGIMRAADNGDYTTFMSFNYCANAPAGVPITHTIAGRKMATDPINHYIRRARILALRLSNGRFNNTAAGYGTQLNTTQTTFQQAISTTWTYGVSGNWLFLNSARVLNTSTSYQTEVRVQLNNTSTCGQQLMKPKNATDLLNFSSIDIRNLTSPRMVDMDWRTTNAGGTAQVRRMRFYGLPLDAQ